MRFLSLSVWNYRLHKELTVAFDARTTLIAGPNESGKSTLVEALHRVLFLRAKGGGAVMREMQSALHDGDPRVALDFEAGGQRWKIEKQFSAKGTALLSGADGRALRDDEAESKLAELLGVELAGGRGAGNQLSGLWSHLWVWQGKAGEDPSGHAGIHRDALVGRLQQHGLPAVMQSAADLGARAKVEEEYAAVFTNTGKLKAGSPPEQARLRWEAARKAAEAASEAAARLEQEAQTYAQAEREIREAETALPELRKSLQSVSERLTLLGSLRQDEERLRERVSQSQAAWQRQSEIDRQITAFHADLQKDSSALQPALERESSLSSELIEARRRSEDAGAAFRSAAEAFRVSRQQYDLENAAAQEAEKRTALGALQERATEAQSVRDQASEKRSALAMLPPVTREVLEELRTLDLRMRQASAVLQTMTTSVQMENSGNGRVLLNGVPLQPGWPRGLEGASLLEFSDGTRVQVIPGGEASLAEANGKYGAARERWVGELTKWSLTGVGQAEEIFRRRQILEDEIQQLHGRWKGLDGDRLPDRLNAATLDFQAASSELERRRAAMPAGAVSAPSPALALEKMRRCEAEEEAARKASEHWTAAMAKAAKALEISQQATAAKRQELRDLETRIRVMEEAHGQGDARRAALEKSALESQMQKQALDEATSAIRALLPEQLTADEARFRRSVQAQETRRADASERRLMAWTRLISDGSSDPEAEIALAEAAVAAAKKSYDAELLRAKAVERLYKLFSESTEAVIRSLMEPLEKRISEYLHFVFGPGAVAQLRLEADGEGMLEFLRPGHAAFSFESLSGGAKEQVAAAARLAMAEILAGDHGGVLPLVFDDAFGFSDPERQQALLGMLDFAASVRGLQIIVVTCAPERLAALGAMRTDLSPSLATKPISEA